ncbi:reverse transcriptase domain-containing protein [Tanacetum coccineum]
MSTRSSTTKLVDPFFSPESVIRNRQRNRGKPSLLFDFEEINMDPNNNHGPPPAGPIPQNQAPDLRTMEELCQSTMLGRGSPIAPMTMQATDFGLKNHMIKGESSRSITSSSPEIVALTQQIVERNNIFLRMSQSNQQVNVVNPSCETCGGPHHYSQCQATGGITQGDGALPSNTIPNPQEDIKVITTRSGITLVGPLVPSPNPLSSSKEEERDPETTVDQMPDRNPHQPPIPYPSRLNKDKLQDKSNIQIHKFLQMFKKLHFNTSFAEALAQMPKYVKMLKDLLTNKEKLLELANTPLNENFSTALLKKLPDKLGDPGKFLIPCDFSELEGCLALANLAASINLMPLSVGKLTFPADFIVVDYDVDPRVPLILGRPFLRTARVLVDVHGEELTLRVGDGNIIFNVESTSKYPHHFPLFSFKIQV